MVQPLNLLLVEDNPSDVELFREALARCGDQHGAVHLAVSETADEAWELLQEGTPPDLVVLDYNLPGAKGNELLHQIRHQDTIAGLPVVVMSSSRAHRDIDTAYREHCNAYILKPDHFRELVAIVDGLCSFFGRLVTTTTRQGSQHGE